MSHSYLYFPLSEDLSAHVKEVIKAIFENDDKKAHSKALTVALQNIAKEALDFFILGAVGRQDLNRFAAKSVEVGGATVGKGVSLVIAGIMRGMSNEQLQEMAEFLQEITTDNVG